MCLLNFVLCFKINYKCSYGEAVYVVGNITQLGNWNPAQAFKLQWTEGHNWTQKLQLIHDNTKEIEYKYIIAPDNKTLPLANILWEKGSNHYLNLLFTSNLFVMLNDEWEHLKIKIILRSDADKNHLHASQKRVVLHTNLKFPLDLDKHLMTLERNMINEKTKDGWIWTASFMLPSDITNFRYKYLVFKGENMRQETTTHLGTRDFCFPRFNSISAFDKFHVINGSTFVKYDFDLSTSLNYNQITEDILVGSSPQNSKHVNHLAALGVTAVLNLQTLEDMKRYGTDWESLQDLYQKANITVKHIPILDMNVEDLTVKIKDAADVLHELLLLNHRKVFLHCTAGRFRSPNVLVFYLNHFKSFSVDESIRLIKSKRPFAKIIEEKLLRRFGKHVNEYQKRL